MCQGQRTQCGDQREDHLEQIKEFHLWNKGLSSNTNFSSLLSLSESLKRIALSENNFPAFLDLPEAIRKRLDNLGLQNCNLSHIPLHLLEGYDNLYLGVGKNSFHVLPNELFNYVKTINYQDSEIEWDMNVWNNIICSGGLNSLQRIIHDKATSSLSQLPDIGAATCARDGKHDLQLQFKKVSCITYCDTFYFLMLSPMLTFIYQLYDSMFCEVE